MLCLKYTLFSAAILYFQLTNAQVQRTLNDLNNRFFFAIFKNFPKDENLFISPASLYTSLAILYAGAKQETAAEMSKVLEYEKANLNDEDIHAAFSKFLTNLKNYTNGDFVDISNALFASNDHPLLSDFEELLKENYDALLKGIDFSSGNQQTVKDINGWIKEKTNGKIDQTIDNISEDTRLMLLSVVYFNGIWKTEFNSNTTSTDIFYNHGKDEVPLSMMETVGYFNCLFSEDKGIKAIEIPYQGDKFSMIIILPMQLEDLLNVEKNIDADRLNEILTEMSSDRIKLQLPKFKLEISKTIKNQLINLGIKRAFSEEADFSGIDGNHDLYVSDVLHKAVIEVNEKGSVASSASVIKKNYRSIHSIEFFVNRPFLFYILERKANTILFAGRVQQL